MRAVTHTNKWSATIFRLRSSTCTNDLVVNSKRSSVIKDFLFAFCIEFNRLFMADSLLMNEVQKHVIIKVEAEWATTKTFFKMNWIENKNALLAFFKTKNDCSFFYKITIFEKNHY